MPIDRDAATPLYQQLAALLREQIEAGQLAGKMPSLIQLAAEYGVADQTARGALRVLRDEGLIETVDGRGTFVRKQS